MNAAAYAARYLSEINENLAAEAGIWRERAEVLRSVNEAQAAEITKLKADAEASTAKTLDTIYSADQ